MATLRAAAATAAGARPQALPPAQMLFQPLFHAPPDRSPFDSAAVRVSSPSPPPQPYSTVALASNQVSFSKSYLDFLLVRFVADVRGAVVAELTVIDAKATDHVKVGAMVQVAYYVLLLEAIIDADATLRAHLRLASHGGIWLFGIRFPPQPCCHPRSP